jgi:hypothetical protein
MARELETIDLDKVRAIGGSCYNHSGQLIKADYPRGGEGYFLGDDYDEYDAKDALVRNILDQQDNWLIRGEIIKVEDDGRSLTITTLNDDVDDDDNDIKVEGVDYVSYEWLDVEVLVNHVTKFEVVRKAGSLK